MRSWIMTSIAIVGLAIGTVKAAEDGKELAAKGYATFKTVLAGDDSKLADAIRYMEESRQADDTNAGNLFNLSRAYFFEGLTLNKPESAAKAEKVLARVIDLDPKRVDALSFHGSLLTFLSREQGLAKFFQGVKEMKAAIEQAPSDIGARIVLAFTSLKFPPEALAAINYDPSSDLQMVANVFDQFHSDFAPHASVVMNAILAETYKQKGDNEKARAGFEKALSVPAPKSEGAQAGRAILDQAITARMNGGAKSIFEEPVFGSCHSCHLTAPDKLLQK